LPNSHQRFVLIEFHHPIVVNSQSRFDIPWPFRTTYRVKNQLKKALLFSDLFHADVFQKTNRVH
jgi:hypothetical protein